MAGAAFLGALGVAAALRCFKEEGQLACAEGTLPLDSFAPPALALSVLKEEQARLVATYLVQRDQAGRSDRVAPGSRGQSDRERRTVPSAAAPDSAPGPEGAIAALTRLSDQIAQLKQDVDGQLLWVEAEDQREGEFLDRYLALVPAAGRGAKVDLVLWFPRAWQAARHCNRAEELTDALRHLIRYRQAPWAGQALAGMLAQRGAGQEPEGPLEAP